MKIDGVLVLITKWQTDPEEGAQSVIGYDRREGSGKVAPPTPRCLMWMSTMWWSWSDRLIFNLMRIQVVFTQED